MTSVLVRHKVKDYEKWKIVFDEHSNFRKENGSKGGHLFRNANDPNETVIIFEWDNLENAKKFVQSENLKEAMKKAGVTGKPTIYFLEEIEKLSV